MDLYDGWLLTRSWLQREMDGRETTTTMRRASCVVRGDRVFVHTAPSSMGKYMRSVMKASMSPGLG